MQIQKNISLKKVTTPVTHVIISTLPPTHKSFTHTSPTQPTHHRQNYNSLCI